MLKSKIKSHYYADRSLEEIIVVNEDGRDIDLKK